MSFLAAAGIAAGGALLGSAMGSKSQSDANKANMELAKYQHSKNVEMWHMQNAYNSPEEQMKRLKNAKLNPNMVYGPGAVANNAGTAPEYKAPHMQAYTGFGNLGMNDASNIWLQGRMNEAQVNNLEQQNSLIKSQNSYQQAKTISETLNQAQTQARTARTKFDLDLAKSLKRYTLEAAEANIKHTQATTNKLTYDVQNLVSTMEFRELQKKYTMAQTAQVVKATQKLLQDYNYDEFEQTMKTAGIYPNDNVISRFIGRAGKMFGDMYTDEELEGSAVKRFIKGLFTHPKTK